MDWPAVVTTPGLVCTSEGSLRGALTDGNRGRSVPADRVGDHGLPPQSETVTADTPPSVSPPAVPAGRTFRAGWRDDGRDALPVPSPPPAGRRGSREPDHGLGRRNRRAATAASTLGSRSPGADKAPTFGVTGLAARLRFALERHHVATVLRPSSRRRARAGGPTARRVATSRVKPRRP